MKKTIVVFGLISGAVSSVMMMATLPFHDQIGFDKSGYILGYTSIVLSFLLVYFGVRSYRDNLGGGEITFAKAFGVGIAITVISCLCYVATWEFCTSTSCMTSGTSMGRIWLRSSERRA